MMKRITEFFNAEPKKLRNDSGFSTSTTQVPIGPTANPPEKSPSTNASSYEQTVSPQDFGHILDRKASLTDSEIIQYCDEQCWIPPATEMPFSVRNNRGVPQQRKLNIFHLTGIHACFSYSKLKGGLFCRYVQCF